MPIPKTATTSVARGRVKLVASICYERHAATPTQSKMIKPDAPSIPEPRCSLGSQREKLL